MTYVQAGDRQRVITVRTAPDYSSSPIVPVSEIKEDLEIPSADTTDDALLLRYQQAIVLWIEAMIGRRLSPYGLTMTLDHFPGDAPVVATASRGINPGKVEDNAIVLDIRPVTAVDEIRVIDTDNSSSTYATSNYVVDLGSDQWDGRIYPEDGNTFWQTDVTLRHFSAVEVDFTTGYASASAVPQPIKQAITTMAVWMHAHRGDCMDCGKCAMACGADLMLGPYKPMVL